VCDQQEVNQWSIGAYWPSQYPIRFIQASAGTSAMHNPLRACQNRQGIPWPVAQLSNLAFSQRLIYVLWVSYYYLRPISTSDIGRRLLAAQNDLQLIHSSSQSCYRCHCHYSPVYPRQVHWSYCSCCSASRLESSKHRERRPALSH
jgi:hypothetical protein